MMKDLEHLDVSELIKEEDSESLKILLKSLCQRKKTLLSLDLSGNLGVNDDDNLKELQNLIKVCTPLQMLNISTMEMSSANCKSMCEFFISHFKKDWNLNSTLRVLIWDDDLKAI